MTADEIRMDIFEALSARYQPEEGEAKAYVGLQGDNIILLVPGGNHFGIQVIPAKAEVAS